MSLQRITAQNQIGGTVTTGKVRELLTALYAAMEESCTEWNPILFSQKAGFKTKVQNLDFNDNRAVDEVL